MEGIGTEAGGSGKFRRQWGLGMEECFKRRLSHGPLFQKTDSANAIIPILQEGKVREIQCLVRCHSESVVGLGLKSRSADSQSSALSPEDWGKS